MTEWYSRNYKPPAARPQQPGELLFEFARASDRSHFRCELRVHDQHDFEAVFFQAGELRIAYTFPTRALAVQWAEKERKHFAKGGE
jgi:hypothetical protein